MVQVVEKEGAFGGGRGGREGGELQQRHGWL